MTAENAETKVADTAVVAGTVVATPRVFTYWEGPKSPLINLCLQSIVKNIPGIEVWTLAQFEAAYAADPSNKLGPWEQIAAKKPNTQSDLLRYWLLSTYGGIWVDADFIAFRDIRPVWDATADYIGYRIGFRTSKNAMPFTAIMGASPASPVVAAQVATAATFMSGTRKMRNKNSLGPRLTREVLKAQPNTKAVWIERKLIHPIRWFKFKGKPLGNDAFPFDPNAYGLMLVHRVVARFRKHTEEELLRDQTVIGQAFRKALAIPNDTQPATA